MGVAAALLSVAGGTVVASLLSVRFDGALDLHTATAPAAFLLALQEQVTAVAVLTLVATVASRIVARRGRLIDFFIAVGAARLPLIGLAAVLPFISPSRMELEQLATTYNFTPQLALVATLALAAGAWMITWIVTGFRTASGLRGLSLGVTVTITVVVAEIISKVLGAVLPTT